MIAKELIDARWKILVGGGLTLVFAALTVWSYDLVKNLTSGLPASLPAGMQGQISQALGTPAVYIWSQWFGKNGAMLLGGLAAFLGGGLIAGEVSKGTIFFLLSKPLSRDRALLLKYAAAAGIYFAVTLLGSLGLLVVGLLTGHALPLGGVLISTVLLWLGGLSVLGLALLFSVVFDDLLRPVGCALLLAVLVGLPGIVGQIAPGWTAWSLPNYWASLPAYQGTAFPAKELAICLVAALAPLALALPLFRKRAY